MKKAKTYISILVIVLTGTHIFSQDVGGKTLVSQARSTTANIGQCEISIKYHSPSVNGRKIFGGIVPFDFVVEGKEYPWRAGSNQRTTIDFSYPVEIEGKRLDSGSYGFVVLVSEEEWTLIFSSGKSWGSFNYEKENDVIRVPVKTHKTPFREWLSYDFINPKGESVDIQLRWEQTAVVFNVRTNSLENILMNLEKIKTKSASDYQELAVRTLEKDQSTTTLALEYLEKSKLVFDTMKNQYYQAHYRFSYKVMKGEILISQGKNKEGEKLIEEAWDSAQGFNIYYYALRKYAVEGMKEEAFEILNKGIKTYPENFQTQFAFGEYYLKEKDQVKATEHFKIAFELAKAQDSWVNYAGYLYLQNKLVLGSQ